MTNRAAKWLRANRSSTRLVFFLQIGCRVGTSLFALLWTPLLLRSMGKALNGLFLNFQSLATLGGLGDLGVGVMVNIQTSRLLGQGKEAELRSSLAAARAFFLIMAVAAFGVFLVWSPSVLRGLKFETVPLANPLFGLSLVGALAVGLVILNSYINNLNYGCSNLLWPVLPAFVILQLGIFGHWFFALRGFPLWVQYSPYVAAAILAHGVGWLWLRLAYPSLATVWPLSFDWQQILSLMGKSFWVYLYCLSNGVYVATDKLLITAGFGPALVPTYQYNNKLCELALFVINSASLASLPKITQWLASPESATRERALRETERLNKFQSFLACAAALIYLAINDLFIRYWLGPDMRAPLWWQAAFASTMAVTAAGLVGYDLSLRCCEEGIRVGGITVGLTAVLNLGLALFALRLGSVLGIALATLASQSVAVLALGWYSCRHLKISWWRISLRNWLLALASAGLGLAMRHYLPMDSWLAAGITAGVYAAALLAVAFLLGIRMNDLREEVGILRGIFGNRAKG
jgi:O-antigen/teichoic acid export membrane protein